MPKHIGLAADHGGYELKEYLAGMLRSAGHEVIDFGDGQPKVDDDYPDFVVPLARALPTETCIAAWQSVEAALGHRSLPTKWRGFEPA